MLLLFAVGAQADYSIGERVAGASALKDGDLVVFEAASTTNNAGYYIKETSSNSYAWQKGFDQSSVWKVVVSSTTETSFGTHTYYYLQNVQTGRYMAGTNSAPTTVESQSDADLVAFYGKDQPWGWQTYSDQTANPTGWDDNSVVIRLITGTSDYWLANDVGNQATGALPNRGGLHNWTWNAYYAVENTPTPTPNTNIITVGEGQGLVLGSYLTDISQLETGNYLLVVNSANQAGNYVYQDQSDLAIKREDAKTGASSYGEKNVVRITVTANQTNDAGTVTGKYVKLQGLNGQYVSVTADGNTPVATAAGATTFLATITTSGIESIYLQDSTNTGNYFNGNGNLVLHWAGGSGDWSKYAVYPVSVQTVSSITWNVVNAAGVTVATETVNNCVPGQEYTTSLASVTGVTLATPTVTATDSAQTISTTYTFDSTAYPFEISSSYNNAKWYQLIIQRSPVKYSQYNAENKHVANTTTAPANIADVDCFAFVGSPFGFRLYNKAAGADAPFGPAAVQNNMIMEAGDASDAATLVYENNSNHAVLRYVNAATGYVNDVNSQLGVWDNGNGATDAGSTFAFTAVDFEAASKVQIGDLYYNLAADGTATVTYPNEAEPSASNHSTYTGDITIPATVTYNGHIYNVTAVGNNAFFYSEISSVTFSEGLKTIGNTAFARCPNITEVTLPNSVTTTGGDAFAYNAKQKKFTLGSGITRISQGLTFGYTMDTVYIYANAVPAGAAYMFSGQPVIHVYPTLIGAYKSTNNWSGYTNYVGDLEKDYTLAEVQGYVSELNTEADGYVAGTDPGFYDSLAVTAFKQALTQYASISETSTQEELNTAVKNLYQLQTAVTINPITEGYYFITSAGNGRGYSGGPYNYEDKDALYNDGGTLKWKAYDRTDKTEVYKISANAAGGYDVYNVADSTYINKGAGSYDTSVSTSATATTAQTFTLLGNGKYAMTWSGNGNVYALANGHNGSAAESGTVGVWGDAGEAANYGVNVWYLRSISEQDVNKMFETPKDTDGYVADITDGYYYIVANWDTYSLTTTEVDSTYYLYKKGAFTAPTEVGDLDLTQIFQITKTGDNTYTILSGNSNKYVGAYNANGTQGTTLAFTASNDDPYNNYIYKWTESPNDTVDTGVYGENTFVVFDTEASTNEWSGRWTGQGYNVHSAIADRVAHAFKFYRVTNLVTEYLENVTLNNAKSVLANTPTSTQDRDLASMGGTWVDGTERTAVAGYETVQEYKDSLSAAIDAYEANKNDSTLAAMQAWVAKVNQKWAPLTDGVYFIIPRFGDDQKTNVVSMTFEASDSSAWRKPLVYTDPNFMFEVKITKSHEDAELGTVPDSMTIKNIGSGLYLGKIDTTTNTWGYQVDPVQIGYITFTGSQFYSDTKHAHCFGLNVGGVLMYVPQTETGAAITTTRGTYAWREAWMFRPADSYYQTYLQNQEFLEYANQIQASLATVTPANHHDNGGARSFLLGNEKLGVDGLATSIDAINALQAAYDTLVAAYQSGTPVSELTEQIAAVNAAKAVVDAKTNPMESGLYYIVAVYGDDTDSIPGGLVLTNNGVEGNSEALSKTAYNATDANQIFQVTLLDSGKVTIQNVVNGKYVGSIADSKWNFTDDAVELNIANANGGRYWWVWPDSRTVAARACGFVLSQGDSIGINSSTAANTQSAAYAIPASGNISAWFCSWAFRPVADSIANNFDPLRTTLENLASAAQNLNGSDEVGDLNKANVDAFKALYASVSAAADTLSAGDKIKAAADLTEAYNLATSSVNPLTTGYYFIRSTARAFGATQYAMYVAEDGTLSWKALDLNDAKQFVFKVEDLDSVATINGTDYDLFSFQSYATDKYISYGSAVQRGNATTADTPWGLTVAYSSAHPQMMIQPVWMTRLALAQCLGVNTAAATSGTIRQASTLNADADSTIYTWVFVRADQYVQEDSIVDIYDIAADATAPVEGKTYVLKNAYNSKYLSTNGGTVTSVNTIAKSEIWTIEASGKTADGQPTYYLKSATQPDTAAYWQYEDYGSKTWDATTPYDGYDWFGYAGLNAEFGPAATAQEFTILPATANADPDTRTGVASGKEPTGYVLTAAVKIFDKFYKLGVQGNNAAMEPYNEDVAWTFLEATGVSDPDSALQIALTNYGQKEMRGGTAPGYYSAGAVDQYNEIVSDAKAAQEGTAAEKRASVQALLATDTLTFETNPIVEGYYYIVSAGNGPGYSGGPYNNEERWAMYNDANRVKFAEYDSNSTRYVYQLTQSGDNWMAKNIQDNSYIGEGTAAYDGEVTATEGASVAQVFTLEKEGKYAINPSTGSYVYSTAANHNGATAAGNLSIWGTPAEAGTYGVNLWYLVPCSDEMIQKITGIGGIAAAGNGTGVEAGDGKITITSDKAQTIYVYSTIGAIAARQQVAAGQTVSIYLVPGVYIVNGKKVAVK